MSETGEGQIAIAAGRADASSSTSGHEASFGVDGDEATYWASGATDGAIFTIDLDGEKRVDRVEISWEQPATAFDIELASGGWRVVRESFVVMLEVRGERRKARF